jgi:Holliday junction resolvase RusA-like endonuclease
MGGEVSRKIEFFVPGPPVGKGRPRAARRGAGVVMFTPEKTVGYETLAATTAGNAMRAHQPLDGPLEAVLEMRFPVPASWSKAKRVRALAGAEWHTSKPDADNVAKAILDACNGVVFRDDAQVVMLIATKAFSEEPGVRVVIREVQNERP